MNKPLTDREHTSLVETSNRIELKVDSMAKVFQDFVISQTKVNAKNKAELKTLTDFKKRVVQVFMAFILSTASISAKYTFEDKPAIEIKTEKKEG